MVDAIVPAGGSARRLDGADKPGVLLDGTSLLDHVLTALADSTRIVVVGPPRPTIREVLWRRESPIGGGPVAAIAAALDVIETPVCLVVAADVPRIAPALPGLLDAVVGHDAAVLTSDGRRNHLAAAWRTSALSAAIDALDHADGAAVRTLFAGRDVVEVDDLGGWGRDCDTWADLAALA